MTLHARNQHTRLYRIARLFVVSYGVLTLLTLLLYKLVDLPGLKAVLVQDNAFYNALAQEDFEHWSDDISLIYLVANLLMGTCLVFVAWYVVSLAMRREAAQLDLVMEREKFRIVADFTYDWEFWMAPSGEFIYMSPACERITGYSIEEFTQDSHLLERLIHPDDYDEVVRHLDKEHREQGVHKIDFRIRTADGVEKWIAHTCQPVFSDAGHFIGRRASNRDITDRKQMELALEQSATHDSLTGLPNRKLLYERLDQLFMLVQRAKTQMAILFIDLDHFKEINDELGHTAGNYVLLETAGRMNQLLRQGDTLARLGGDEFVVILTDRNTPQTSQEMAHGLLKEIHRDIDIPTQDNTIAVRRVSASIGISFYPDNGESIDRLINAADEAMYLAKASGRNQVRFAAEVTDNAVQEGAFSEA